MVKTVGILYQPVLEAARLQADALSVRLSESGVQCWTASSWNEGASLSLVNGSDLLFALGGDGTLLRAARLVAHRETPIIGVNYGRLGFMTEISPENLFDTLPRILDGDGWLEERMLLRVEAMGAERPLLHTSPVLGLNDVVVSRGARPRPIYFHLTIDGAELGRFVADGIIVSTPTGSTAYAYAVGGPILDPQMDAFVVVPVAPHIGLGRALVLPPTAEVEIRVDPDQEAVLSVDGQVELADVQGVTLRVRRSRHRARFLRFQPRNYFFATLNARLA